MGLVAMGTRVFRKTDGTVVIVPPQTEYQPKPGEVEVAEVCNITIDFPVGGAIKATIMAYPTQDVVINALPKYIFARPGGGQRNIEFVEFDDGSRWFWDGRDFVETTSLMDEFRKYKKA